MQLRFVAGLGSLAMAGMAMVAGLAQASTAGSQGGLSLETEAIAQNRPHYSTLPMPTEGTFAGRGIATESVFTIGRQAEAVLSFNATDRFSISLAGRYANNLEVAYSGIITRRLPGTRGINGFILETQVDSFASSMDDRRVVETAGTCRIEVFDARVVESVCSTSAPNSNTEFQGMEQF